MAWGGSAYVESNLQPAGECNAIDDRRRNSSGHAAGADRQRQGQGAYRGHHCGDPDQFDRDRRVLDACQYVDPRLTVRRRRRLLPDRLDRAERYFSLPAYGCYGPVRTIETRRRWRHRGPALAALADRVFVRRVLRRRLGLRYAGRRNRRGADRAGLLSAGRIRSVADREYRASRLWRARHADCGIGAGHRVRSLHSRRDGWPAIAGILADRTVLGGVGVRRLERHEGRLAGHSGYRRVVRDPAIRDLELYQSLD